MLMPLTVVVAGLSALSIADPATDWPAALVLSVTGGLQTLMPAGASEQVKPAVTSVLFQPFAFAAGERLPTMVGAFLSSRTVTEPLPAFPRRSVAVAVLVTPEVVAVCESVAGVGPLATPEPASLADHATETLELFQPAALGVGESAAVTTGPALSRIYDAGCGFCDWPVQLLALKLGEAAALTACTPLPAPAVKMNVQDDFAVLLVCMAVCAPVIWTHFVSLEVVTVSVKAPPFFAYSVPPTLTVPPPPPENDADDTVEP